MSAFEIEWLDYYVTVYDYFKYHEFSSYDIIYNVEYFSSGSAYVCKTWVFWDNKHDISLSLRCVLFNLFCHANDLQFNITEAVTLDVTFLCCYMFIEYFKL